MSIKKFDELPNATSLLIETGSEFSLDSLASRLSEIFRKKFLQFEKNEEDFSKIITINYF